MLGTSVESCRETFIRTVSNGSRETTATTEAREATAKATVAITLGKAENKSSDSQDEHDDKDEDNDEEQQCDHNQASHQNPHLCMCNKNPKYMCACLSKIRNTWRQPEQLTPGFSREKVDVLGAKQKGGGSLGT